MELTELKLSTWEDFEAEIRSLFEKVKKRQAETKMIGLPPLFRGHVNASWKLETTLERYSKHQYSMREYYYVMRAVRPKLESFTEKTWNFSDEYTIDERQYRDYPPLGYEFMIYLRHHAFPSPLLDWTRSPYVAAFFAFRTEGIPEDDSVAIYSYIENEWQSRDVGKASIFRQGPTVKTHKRHYAQQSDYTICKKLGSNGYIYCSYEEAIGGEWNVLGALCKYIIPREERVKALERLHMMNINAYSLFGDEETLMKTLAYQEIAKGSF